MINYEDEVRDMGKIFMNFLFDETEGDEYKSVGFDLVYNKTFTVKYPLQNYNGDYEILKSLVKQYLVNKDYILIDDSNEENILITLKGKQDYIKL